MSLLKKVRNNPENRGRLPTCRGDIVTRDIMYNNMILNQKNIANRRVFRLAGDELSDKSEQVLREAMGFFRGLRNRAFGKMLIINKKNFIPPVIEDG